MPSILEIAGYINDQGEQGRKRGLAQLLGQAYSAPPDQRQQILGTVAERGAPGMAMQAQQGFSKMDETSAADLAREAGMFVALAQSGDEQTIQTAYQQLARKAQASGHPVPMQYNPSFLPGIEKLASAGKKGDGVPADIRTLQMLRDNPELAALDAKRRQAPKYMWTDRGLVAVSPDGATPIEYGGSGTQFTPNTSYQTPSGIVRIGDVAPEDMAAVEADMRSGGAQDNYNLPPQDVSGGIVQPAAKAPPAITPYQQAQLGMQQQRLEASQQAAQRAAEAAQAAQAAKQQVAAGKAQKARVAAQDSVDAYTDAISTIDAMRSHPGYADLGTIRGDIETSVPLIRTDAKGASAALETLKSQIMINTLSKLKALSATGAAGFGALNQSEGDALRRAIANLDTAQSHADLDRAVLRVREVMQRSAQRIAEAAGGLGQDAQPAAPQTGGVDDLLSKYGVK